MKVSGIKRAMKEWETFQENQTDKYFAIPDGDNLSLWSVHFYAPVSFFFSSYSKRLFKG